MISSRPVIRYLDEPIRFLSFSSGEWAAFSAPFFVGSLVDSLFIVPVLGILSVAGVRKMLKKLPKFYAARFLYASIPTLRLNRMLRVNLPPSHTRFWVS